MNGQRSQRLAAIVVEHCSAQTVRNLIARLALIAPNDAGAAIARGELLEAIEASKKRRRPSAFAPRRERAILDAHAAPPSNVRTS